MTISDISSPTHDEFQGMGLTIELRLMSSGLLGDALNIMQATQISAHQTPMCNQHKGSPTKSLTPVHDHCTSHLWAIKNLSWNGQTPRVTTRTVPFTTVGSPMALQFELHIASQQHASSGHTKGRGDRDEHSGLKLVPSIPPEQQPPFLGMALGLADRCQCFKCPSAAGF